MDIAITSLSQPATRPERIPRSVLLPLSTYIIKHCLARARASYGRQFCSHVSRCAGASQGHPGDMSLPAHTDPPFVGVIGFNVVIYA